MVEDVYKAAMLYKTYNIRQYESSFQLPGFWDFVLWNGWLDVFKIWSAKGRWGSTLSL